MGRPRMFDLDDAVADALQVFWKRGYGATTPAELVDALGVGKGSFYNAFESKHALFVKALRKYGDDRVAGLARWFAAPGSVRQRVRSYFEKLADKSRLGCFAANTAAELGRHDPEAARVVADTFARMERVLEDALAEGHRRGEHAHEPKEVASLLLAALVGVTVLAKVDSPPARTMRIARAAASLLQGGHHD